MTTRRRAVRAHRGRCRCLDGRAALDERNEFFFACIHFCFTARRPHSSSCRGLQKLHTHRRLPPTNSAH
jgi:hypothetical protein